MTALDQFENATDSESARTLVVDTTPPAPGVALTPAAGRCTNAVRPEFTWSACSDASGIAEYVLLVDEVPAAEALDAQVRSATPTLPLAAGTHTWSVRCVDLAGNAAVTPTGTFAIDIEPPVVSADAADVSPDGVVTLSGAVEDAGTCGVERVEVESDGTWAAADLEEEGAQWRYRWSPAEGTTTLQVKAVDRAGNESEPATAIVTVGPCWTLGDCDLSTGNCATQLDAGASCSDTNACTTRDECNAAGECLGDVIVCDDDNVCTDDACDPIVGCVNANNDRVCEDDGNPCTDDLCSGGACVHVTNTEPCDDGNACTLEDRCDGGTCTGEGARTCDDDNVCTDGHCDPAAGCVNEPNTAPCDDEDPCTTNGCREGICAVTGTIAGCCHDDFDCEPQVERCVIDTHVCQTVQCEPCTTAADCGPVGNECVEFPSGQRCVVDCVGGAGLCPDDAVCQGDPDGAAHCFPSAGDCSCVSHHDTTCAAGDVYWTTSCGELEGLESGCEGRGCVDATCCPSGTYEKGGGCVEDSSVEPSPDVADWDAAAVDVAPYTDLGDTGDSGSESLDAAVPTDRAGTSHLDVRRDADPAGQGNASGGCSVLAHWSGSTTPAFISLVMVWLIIGWAVRRRRRSSASLRAS